MAPFRDQRSFDNAEEADILSHASIYQDTIPAPLWAAWKCDRSPALPNPSVKPIYSDVEDSNSCLAKNVVKS